MADDLVALRVAARIPHAKVGADTDLLHQALLALRPEGGRSVPVPRWSLVSAALGHGSGVATAICDALGLTPDEDVWGPPPECEHCGLDMEGPDTEMPGGPWWCWTCGEGDDSR